MCYNRSMIIKRFYDDLYDFQETTHIRNTARALARDEAGRFVFLRIQGEDMFGERDHLETCGGGMEENETPEETLRREVMEELGYRIKKAVPLGTIIDEYHLIQRETHSHFFYCELDTSVHYAPQWTDLEKTLLKDAVHLSVEEALHELEFHQVGKVGTIVQRRDLFALRYLIEHFPDLV